MDAGMGASMTQSSTHARELTDWLSVEDQLPEIDFSAPEYMRRVGVIACWGSKPEQVAEMSYVSNAYAKTVKGRAPRFEWQGRVSPWKVTHWMPLPIPPMSGKEPA
jgi:hypothetical protein